MAAPETPIFAEMWARERQTVAEQVAAGIASHVEGEDHRRPRGLVVLGCVIGSPGGGGGGGGLAEIARYTVPAGAGEATIDLTGLDQGYDHLWVWGRAKTTDLVQVVDPVQLRLNGDFHGAYACTMHRVGNSDTGSGVAVHDIGTELTGISDGSNILVARMPGDTGNGDVATFNFMLHNYATDDGFFKTLEGTAGWTYNAIEQHFTVTGTWRGDSGVGGYALGPVTQLTFLANEFSGRVFAPGSQIIVYGIKGS